MVKMQRLFGLLVESEVELPLPVARVDPGESPCVRIDFGSVEIQGDLVWSAPPPVEFRCFRGTGSVFLEWPVARFEVTAHRVVVETEDPETAAILLLQAVWSVVLSEHAQPAFHGGTVANNGLGLAVMGESGSGKSTALLSLLDSGWSLVADDMLVLDGHLRAQPGPPFIRLLDDRATGRAGEVDAVGKLRYFPDVALLPVPLAGLIVHGEDHRQPTRLFGTAAVGAVLSHMYNDVVPYHGLRGRHFQVAISLAETVPIFGVPPRSLDKPQLDQIAREAGFS